MSKDDFITLPTGIDFRKPGQMAPWDWKRYRERQVGLNEALGRSALELMAAQQAAALNAFRQHHWQQQQSVLGRIFQ